MLVPVILSGGSGTRLWPTSRQSLPKQFVRLVDRDRSLLQSAAQRLNALSVSKSGLFLVANDEHRFMLTEQLLAVGADIDRLILEPCPRNTAPAIALAAMEALTLHDDPSLLVQTADHVIADIDYFAGRVEAALQSGCPLVTFGVRPTHPETGYGYIKGGQLVDGTDLFNVDEFKEKPDAATAEWYLEDGGYLWNSGMFLLNAKTFLEELEHYCPEIIDACQSALGASVRDGDVVRIDADAFGRCPSDSVDYAVMERSDRVSVLRFDGHWSDLGAWDAVHDALPMDADGNAAVGDALMSQSSNTLVRAESRLVVTHGVANVVVVETPDVVLVADRDSAQGIKPVVETLKSQKRAEATEHTTGYRPWGTYESICKGERFQVKKIVVRPGRSLSLQMHHHRAEHWIVVQGTAEVVNGDDVILLKENESTYIPVGCKHRLTNPGQIDLVLIEVQSGSYLGEDDIVRFEDTFGRV